MKNWNQSTQPLKNLEKDSSYEYSLPILLDLMGPEEANQMKARIAERLDIGVRMLENYIYSKRDSRRYKLSPERLAVIASMLDIDLGLLSLHPAPFKESVRAGS